MEPVPVELPLDPVELPLDPEPFAPPITPVQAAGDSAMSAVATRDRSRWGKELVIACLLRERQRGRRFQKLQDSSAKRKRQTSSALE